MFCPMKSVCKSPKLKKWWTGPWTVQEVLLPGVQWGQKKMVVQGDLIKPASVEVRVVAILVVLSYCTIVN